MHLFLSLRYQYKTEVSLLDNLHKHSVENSPTNVLWQSLSENAVLLLDTSRLYVFLSVRKLTKK
jgi:hypothetical protein